MSDVTSTTVITIKYSDEKTAKAILGAISPDNMNLPNGMHITACTKRNTVELEIQTNRSIGSLVSTLDDLLSCIQAAEKALEEI